MVNDKTKRTLMVRGGGVVCWWRGCGNECGDGVGGSMVGMAFGGGGIEEVVVVAMVWRVVDDVGVEWL
ncbi:hypothetical protein Tco_0004187 [Tanacetum coccineum]